MYVYIYIYIYTHLFVCLDVIIYFLPLANQHLGNGLFVFQASNERRLSGIFFYMILLMAEILHQLIW